MLTIMRHQMLSTLLNMRFFVMTAIILLAFLFNGIQYSNMYALGMADWESNTHTVTNLLEQRSDNLQEVSYYWQRAIKPPSALAFIHDGGQNSLPNTMRLNAFSWQNPDYTTRDNEMIPLLGPLDWSFIVGSLATLAALMMSFSAICGEKRDGTLKVVLSYPISRLSLLAGKFLGIYISICTAYLLGVLVNLLTLSVFGEIPLNEEVLVGVVSALTYSLMLLAFSVLIGMAVSSMTARPAVSLVVLLIFWVTTVIALPGVARLIAELTHDVTGALEVERAAEAAVDQVNQNHPDEAGNWNGDPFAENIPLRAAWVQDTVATLQKLQDENLHEQIDQARAVDAYAAISPSGLVASAFQGISGTGIDGFKSFLDSCRDYSRQLHTFVVHRDAVDPDTPHLVYSWWGGGSDRGVFSQKPVDMDEVPRYYRIWRHGGFYGTRSVSLLPLTGIAGYLLAAAVLAFLALMRYDPR